MKGLGRMSRIRGYLLIELALFVGLLAVVSTHSAVLAKKRMEARQVDRVVQVFSSVTQVCLAFRVRHGRWPFTTNELFYQMNLYGKLPLRNGLGGQVSLDIHRSQVFIGMLPLETTLPTEALATQVLLRLGNTARRSGKEVTLNVPIPGTEHSHSALLPRAGNRHMDGNLNLNRNYVVGVRGLNLANRAPASGVIQWQNNGHTARMVVDELWVNSIKVKNLDALNINWGYPDPVVLPSAIDY